MYSANWHFAFSLFRYSNLLGPKIVLYYGTILGPKGSKQQNTKKVKQSFTDIYRILHATAPKINIPLQIGIFNNF